jgi:hypothetical protein
VPSLTTGEECGSIKEKLTGYFAKSSFRHFFRIGGSRRGSNDQMDVINGHWSDQVWTTVIKFIDYDDLIKKWSYSWVS